MAKFVLFLFAILAVAGGLPTEFESGDQAECFYPIDADTIYPTAKLKAKLGGQILQVRDVFENILAASQAQTEYRLLEEQSGKELNDDKKLHQISAGASEFREDVALLRAFAILAVLAYHHWPSIFPLGFIGVDIFFVLSGFLMFRILESASNRFDRVFLSFYYRRVKRIVPLYYLIMFLIGFSIMFVYSSVWAKQYFRFYFAAVFFYSNLELLKAEGDYFSENTEKLPFLHTWSLGVEMQFYLIAPVLYYISRIKPDLRIGEMILLCCLFISLYFQFNSTPIISFYHPFGRIWEFLCGGLASLFTMKNRTTFTQFHSTLLSIISLIITLSIFLPFFSKITPPSLFQIVITISSTGFIIFSTNCTISWSRFNLNYISTISYALYLVHFPVLRFLQYFQQYYDQEIYVSLISLLITFLISILFHHFYEKPMLRARKFDILIVTLKYFALCLLIGWKWEMVVRPDCVRNSAITENQRFLNSTYKIEGGHFVADGFMKQPKPPFGHYVYDGNKGHLKIAIIGNSWAAQEAHLVREYFTREEVAEMHLFPYVAYTFGLHGFQKEVQEQIPFFMDFLEKLQPDYVFLLARFVSAAGDPVERRDLSPFQGPNDLVLDEYWKGISNISLFTKKIFIQTHQPFECHGNDQSLLNRFLDALQNSRDLSKFNRHIDIVEFYNSPVYKRLRIIFEKCPKCYPIDIAEPFIDFKQNRALVYDPNTQLVYFDNTCHLTEAGLKMIEKPFRQSITNGINNVRVSNRRSG
ncbi:unnamed protein product, partial [Mesorhabditis belari]|uniref:Acyltransferase n=1 Tax=Mesorhabditis belari TaxID=2138241 RepID=A0AAF3J452_9BILA